MRTDPSTATLSVAEIAADWADRLTSLSAEETRALEAWLAEAEPHRRAFDRMQRLMGDQALGEALEAARAEPPTALAPSAPRVQTDRRRPAVRRPARRGGPRSIIPWGIGLAAAAVAAVAVFVARPHSAAGPAVPAPQTAVEYASTLGAPADAKLADRSIVHLDAQSAVRVAFTDHRREVRLEHGEAMFEVAHDPGRPFDVNAAGATVTAVGTLFDVDLAQDLVDIRVLQGVVKVRPEGGETRLLKAGEQLTLETGRTPLFRRFSPDLSKTWRSSWLDAEDMPLHQALARLNRYTARPVVLKSEALATAPVSGSFNLKRTDAAVAILAALLDLDVTRDERATYLTPRANIAHNRRD